MSGSFTPVCPVIAGEELEKLFHDAPTAELPVELLGGDSLTVLEVAIKAKAVPSHCKLQ